MNRRAAWWRTAHARNLLHQWVQEIAPGAWSVFADHGASNADLVQRTVRINPQQLARASFLPVGWNGLTVTTMTDLELRIARCLARHEAGHLRFSQPTAAERPSEAWLWNVLEDERIERLVGRIHPLAAREFAALGALLSRHAFIELWMSAPPAVRLLTACLAARWDQHGPPENARALRLAYGRDHDDHAMRFWTSAIEPLVRLAWEAPSSQAVMDLARCILARLESAFGALTDDYRLPVIMTGDVIESSSGIGGSSESLGQRACSESAPASAPAPTGAARSARTARTGGLPRSLERSIATLRLLARRLADHLRAGQAWRIDVSAAEPRRLSIPALVRSAERHPWETRQCSDAALAIAALVDCTGSMRVADSRSRTKRISSAQRALLMLDLAATQARIPLALGRVGGAVPPNPPVQWIRRCADPMHDPSVWERIMELTADGNAECYSIGLRSAAAELAHQAAPLRLVVLIHDGEPTDESPEQAAAAVADLRAQGMVPLGVFLGVPNAQQRRNLKAMFDSDVVIAPNVAALPDLLAWTIRAWF